MVYRTLASHRRVHPNPAPFTRGKEYRATTEGCNCQFPGAVDGCGARLIIGNDTLVIKERFKSGGVIGIVGTLWEAELRDQGHHNGFIIRVRQVGGEPTHVIHTEHGVLWGRPWLGRRQLLHQMVKIDALSAIARRDWNQNRLEALRRGHEPTGYYVYVIELDN